MKLRQIEYDKDKNGCLLIKFIHACNFYAKF